ncbi:cbb3-type cytochrome c oxidase subunit I, partial [Streptomyces sp. PB17]
IMSNEQFNQAFTMHGTIMLLMFATPLFAGFANWIMPLQIGAPDVAFPRLNMFAYWLYLFGSTIAVGGFLTPQGAADFGWFAYSPLSDAVHSPGIGGDLWIMGLAFSGFGTILGSVNFITTIICMRAPGMTMFRMPIFTWNVLLTGVLVLLAFPVLAAALFALEADRKFGAHIFDS